MSTLNREQYDAERVRVIMRGNDLDEVEARKHLEREYSKASDGVEPVEYARVKPGDKVQVNNRTLSAPEDGFTLVKRGKLREVSIVSMGCDDRTAVAIAAAKGFSMNVDEEGIRA